MEDNYGRDIGPPRTIMPEEEEGGGEAEE
jgi:hypothetical protein